MKDARGAIRSSKVVAFLAAAIMMALTLGTALALSAGDVSEKSAELGKKTAKTSDHIDKYLAQLDNAGQAPCSVSLAQSKDLKKLKQFSNEAR